MSTNPSQQSVNTGWSYRSLNTGSPSRTSNLHLRSHVVLNSSVFVRNSVSLSLNLMSWVGLIRTHRRDEVWSDSLWQTFFITSVGAQIPLLAVIPLSGCSSRKIQIDPPVHVPLTGLHLSLDRRCLRKHWKCHFLQIELNNWFLHILQQLIEVNFTDTPVTLGR
jgi:hypothetical protein